MVRTEAFTKKDISGNKPRTLVGVLAFQGAYAAHRQILNAIGAESIEIRTSSELEICSHIVLPGGESTTMLKLLKFHDMFETLPDFIKSGKPTLATCAGVILLSTRVENPPQESLGLLNATTERNAYGCQIDSFETELDIPALGPDLFHGVFIRAPRIASVGDGVDVLASVDGYPVFIRQGNIFACTFHPELSGDTRIHRMFVEAGE
ncbi:MAG: pyridoxal 5'-phosphate synthase glutaminase subunit PdxT [bacterium]